jgi:hypothetical protein
MSNLYSFIYGKARAECCHRQPSYSLRIMSQFVQLLVLRTRSCYNSSYTSLPYEKTSSVLGAPTRKNVCIFGQKSPITIFSRPNRYENEIINQSKLWFQEVPAKSGNVFTFFCSRSAAPTFTGDIIDVAVLFVVLCTNATDFFGRPQTRSIIIALLKTLTSYLFEKQSTELLIVIE